MMLRDAFIAVLAFAAGVLVCDTTLEYRDEAKAAEVRAQVRSCPGYIVVAADGSVACRLLMPRLDFAWPIQPSPLKLKRREIRRAITFQQERP